MTPKTDRTCGGCYERLLWCETCKDFVCPRCDFTEDCCPLCHPDDEAEAVAQDVEEQWKAEDP